MFDFAPDNTPAVNQETASPRVLALRLVALSSARLLLAASRLGGDDGVALICALRDIVIDASVDPLHWPVAEAIALLRTSAPGSDTQVDRLIDRLEEIRNRIGLGPDARTA